MAEKIRIKGQLKLPVVGRNPIFAQMKFVKVALSEPDILPDSGSIFTCDDQGNYDFEVYIGKHLLSYNVGNSWSKPIEIIAEPLVDGLESIEISDLIGFQEIPELDATIAALNQQKQELLLIQQDVVVKQSAAAASAAAAAADAAKLSDIEPRDIKAVTNVGRVVRAPEGGDVTLITTGNKNIKIKLPTGVGGNIRLSVSITSYPLASSSSGIWWRDVVISGYASADWRNASVSTSLTGVTVYLCYDATDGAYIYLEGSWGERAQVMIKTVESTNVSDLFLSGWSITSDNVTIDPTVIKQTIVTGVGSISSENVKLIEHDGIQYENIDAESAKEIGISSDVFDAALAEQQAQDFFESEKAKAILIMNDHMLGTGEEEITDLQVMDVKAYIQSIDPAKGFKVGIARAKVPRPSIFSRYD